METTLYKHADVTEKIICCAMKVHRYFGAGFPEVVYQRALIIELEKLGLKCRAEAEKENYYEGIYCQAPIEFAGRRQGGSGIKSVA